MAIVKRGAVPAPVLPKETVEVPALGGEVVVRGLLLTEYLRMKNRIATASKDSSEADGIYSILPPLLATCVLDADGQPLWTEDEWQAFGAKEPGQALELFNVASRLSGFSRAQDTKN